MTKSFKLSIALSSIVLFSNSLSLISALRITYPTQDSVLNPSIPTNLTWEYLPTDPLFFDIQLLNTTSTSSNGFAVTIKESQSSNTGFFTLPTNHSLSNGLNYRFVLISSNAALPGILAQSPQFKISSNSSNQTSTNNSVPLPSSYKPINDANSSANSISLSLNHYTLVVTLVLFSYLFFI